MSEMVCFFVEYIGDIPAEKREVINLLNIESERLITHQSMNKLYLFAF